MAAKQKTDWDALEPHYRAGVKSLRQLADEFGCTSGRVAQVAKERGWERDLSAKIAAKAQSKLSRSILSKELSAQKAISENDVVEANATMQANALLGHRTDIGRHRALAIKLLAELEAQTNEPELFSKLAELMEEGNVAALNQAYQKASGTPGRIDSMKKLTETLKTLIGLEREALGIGAGDNGEGQMQVVGTVRLVRA